LSIILPEDII